MARQFSLLLAILSGLNLPLEPGNRHALSAAESAKPNVLFIAIDDQKDWIGAMLRSAAPHEPVYCWEFGLPLLASTG